jgi:hypothetical protein
MPHPPARAVRQGREHFHRPPPQGLRSGHGLSFRQPAATRHQAVGHCRAPLTLRFSDQQRSARPGQRGAGPRLAGRFPASLRNLAEVVLNRTRVNEQVSCDLVFVSPSAARSATRASCGVRSKSADPLRGRARSPVADEQHGNDGGNGPPVPSLCGGDGPPTTLLRGFKWCGATQRCAVTLCNGCCSEPDTGAEMLVQVVQ